MAYEKNCRIDQLAESPLFVRLCKTITVAITSSEGVFSSLCKVISKLTNACDGNFITIRQAYPTQSTYSFCQIHQIHSLLRWSHINFYRKKTFYTQFQLYLLLLQYHTIFIQLSDDKIEQEHNYVYLSLT